MDTCPPSCTPPQHRYKGRGIYQVRTASPSLRVYTRLRVARQVGGFLHGVAITRRLFSLSGCARVGRVGVSSRNAMQRWPCMGPGFSLPQFLVEVFLFCGRRVVLEKKMQRTTQKHRQAQRAWTCLRIRTPSLFCFFFSFCPIAVSHLWFGGLSSFDSCLPSRNLSFAVLVLVPLPLSYFTHAPVSARLRCEVVFFLLSFFSPCG